MSGLWEFLLLQGSPIQYAGQKFTSAFFFGLGENLFRRTFFHNDARVQKQGPARHFAGESHFVRGGEHGSACAGKVAHHGKDFAYQFRVERGSRFVEQQNRRIQGQRPRNRDALLLPAGEFGGETIGFRFELNLF